jgi:hypothetical protein
MKTPSEEKYFDHVMACTKCKIKGRKGKETIEHCDDGKILEVLAIFAAVQKKRMESKMDQLRKATRS